MPGTKASRVLTTGGTLKLPAQSLIENRGMIPSQLLRKWQLSVKMHHCLEVSVLVSERYSLRRDAFRDLVGLEGGKPYKRTLFTIRSSLVNCGCFVIVSV